MQLVIDNIYKKSPTTSITIHGDININLLNLNKPFYNFLLENSLYTTITTPTRFHHTGTHTLIDVTLTTLAQTTTTAGTISPPISDHLPIYTIFENPIPRHHQNKEKTLSVNRYNRNKVDIINSLHTAIIQSQHETNPSSTTAQHFQNIQTALQKTIESHEKKTEHLENHGAHQNADKKSGNNTDYTKKNKETQPQVTSNDTQTVETS
jgi:hypothetical protein